jgi:hypothetical protein
MSSSERKLVEVVPIGLHGFCDMVQYLSAIFALGRFQYGQPGSSLVLYLHSHRLHRLANVLCGEGYSPLHFGPAYCWSLKRLNKRRLRVVLQTLRSASPLL